MEEIRLKKEPFEINGKKYNLTCNMNVLADVQERFGGNLLEALSPRNRMKAALEFCAAMLNECADLNGWPERFTAKEVGRKIAADKPGEFVEKIFGLIYAAIAPEEPENPEEPGKN